MDCALTFGMKSALEIFNAVVDFLAWALHCDGVLLLFHYLNDFLIFGPLGTNIASTVRLLVEMLLTVIGAPIAKHKTEGLSTCITFFWATQFYSSSCRLPSEKVNRLQHTPPKFT